MAMSSVQSGTSDAAPIRVLVVSAMFPDEKAPVRGIVVQREVERLRRQGVAVRVIAKAPGWRPYARQAVEVWRSRKNSIDVVHAHYGTSGLIASLCAGLHRPLVVTLHGSDIALGPRPRFNKYWLQYLLSIAGALRARTVIVQDESMTNLLPGKIRARCLVLGQAVDLDPVDDQEDSETTRTGVLFLSDRSRPVKRFNLAQDAMSLLPGLELRSLDEFAVPDIPMAMSAARVGVLTSEREGMPVAVKEALVAGLRVVCVDLPGLRGIAAELPDVVSLVDHDATALAEAIGLAAAAPALSRAQRERARTVLRECGWSEPERSHRLMRVYAAAIDGVGNRRASSQTSTKPSPAPRAK